jgi:FMN phosphatase YigB (HAD superfamily)
MIREALGRVGLRRHFTHVFTSTELGSRKPDPGFYQAVSREVGLSPRHLLAVGNDLRNDIVPAKAAGMHTVLVSDSIQDWEEGMAADLVVLNLLQLEQLFRAWVLSRRCG